MTTLTPAPSSLGLESPALGPWFSTDVTLGTPGPDLSVAVTLAGNDWLPPTTGLLSLVVATDPRPPAIAGLRNPVGDPAFTTGRLIALFRLLPEVEERLHALSALIPSIDGSTGTSTVPTRARVRYLALQLPEPSPTWAHLDGRLSPPAAGSTDDERAGHVGLTIASGNLANSDHPMLDLKRPGIFLGSAQDKLLHFVASTTCSLFAFDRLGRPIDPGAVAAWWAHLGGTAITNLWAEGISGSGQRTAAVDADLRLHLVNAHEGPAEADVVGRLAMTNINGTGSVRTRGSGTGPAVVAMTAGTEAAAPIPKAAFLPNGTYADSVSLWPGGPVASISRDFVRVALVDVERHLVGQARATTSSADSAQRRAADQARASTRVEVRRAGRPVLRTTAETAAAAIAGVLAGTGPTQVVTSVADMDWGPLTGPSLPADPPPETLPDPTVSALTGGGSATSGTVTNQRALFELDLGANLAGAWVRFWPQEFDEERGRHVRSAGGGGLARAGTGAVTAVLRLPDGDAIPDAMMGVDVLVVTAAGSRFYPDVRFTRPVPTGGAALAFGAAAGELVLCEQGVSFLAGTVPADTIASGTSVVAAESSGPALVDPTTVPIDRWQATTLQRLLGAGDTMQLTEPAYLHLPAGAAVATLTGTGATVQRHQRNGLARLVEPGAPLPSMERLELAVSQISATAASAALGSTPMLGRHHELLPHQAGHAGAPTDDEVHGTGSDLSGPAAIPVAEYARERTAGDTVSLAVAAGTPFTDPADPVGPSPWTALLRTVGFGVETEPGLTDLIEATSNAYPFGDSLDGVRTWLSGNGITIPTGLDAAADSVIRALDRRMRAGSHGYREAAEALAAAVRRAEDFIYIETPAFDDTNLGATDDQLSLWGVLKERLDQRRALRVLVCLPLNLLPGYPAKLGRVRDQLVLAAMESLKEAGDGTATERVAFFTPQTGPGRALRLVSTTVIVDDAFALTGATHLWRRGLCFDSSLAVSVFDETLDDGRPTEVRALRRSLIAGRFGLAVAEVPEDPVDLVAAVRGLSERGGSGRLATDAIRVPDPKPSITDLDIWNHDGSPTAGFDPVGWITALTTPLQGELRNEVPPAP